MKIGFVTTAEWPAMMPYDLHARQILMEKQIGVEILSWEDFDEENVNQLADFDLIVIRTTWNYYKQIQAFKNFLDLVEKSGVKVYNPVKLIKWNMDKKYLQELQSDGFDIIPTIFVFNGEEDSFEQAVARGWKQIVLKPMISAGSYDTFVIDADDPKRFYELKNKFYVNRPYLLQEFLPEIVTGEISTLHFANGYGYSVNKVPKTGDYRVQFQYGGIYHLQEVDPVIENISSRLAEKLGHSTLYRRLDGIWKNGKFLIMELELIEPDLYLNMSQDALNQWVDNLILAGQEN
jgi:glutathione synthase/RimK-type ligase-like ATP-grasp enzyme